MNNLASPNPCQRPGTPTQNWQPDEFATSSFTGTQQGTCVEVAQRPGYFAVRNSTHVWGEGPIVEFTADEWGAFLKGAKAGEFDPA